MKEISILLVDDCINDHEMIKAGLTHNGKALDIDFKLHETYTIDETCQLIKNISEFNLTLEQEKKTHSRLSLEDQDITQLDFDLEEHYIDIILLDMKLPDSRKTPVDTLNTIEDAIATYNIRSANSHDEKVKIILFTGSNFDTLKLGDKEEAYSDSYIYKAEYDINKLISKILLILGTQSICHSYKDKFKTTDIFKQHIEILKNTDIINLKASDIDLDIDKSLSNYEALINNKNINNQIDNNTEKVEIEDRDRDRDKDRVKSRYGYIGSFTYNCTSKQSSINVVNVIHSTPLQKTTDKPALNTILTLSLSQSTKPIPLNQNIKQQNH